MASRQERRTEAYGDGMDHVLLNLPAETTWLNMGYWEPHGSSDTEGASTFAVACETLVNRLAAFARLGEPARTSTTPRTSRLLLEVGCGCGDSLPLWLQRYGFHSVVGITSLPQQVARAQEIVSKLPRASQAQIQVRQGDAVRASEEEGDTALGKCDAIVAVDCAYQCVYRNACRRQSAMGRSASRPNSFSNRSRFLSRAAALLRPGGTLAMTDLVLPCPMSSLPTLTWLLQRILCTLTSAPFENFFDQDSYIASLRTAGFVDVELEDVTDRVFAPLADYIDMRTAESPDGVVGRANGAGVGGKWLQYRVFAKVLRWWAQGRMRFVLVRATKPGAAASESNAS